MTSAHQHYSKYLPPPPQLSQNDLRLPSIKSLNFPYLSPNGTAPAPQPTPANDSTPAPQEHSSNSRHVSNWSRANPPSNPPPAAFQSHPPQQHTPPLSAGHEGTLKVEYSSKHENGGYVHPGMPVSAQATPVQSSVSIGNQQRTEQLPRSPNQPKRPRNTSGNASQSREARQSHASYAHPQYTSYPPVAQQPPAQPLASSTYHHQVHTGLQGPPSHPVQPPPPPPPPPTHEQQVHHHPMPVTAHPSYGHAYQYIPPRQPVSHQQHPTHPPQPTHSNPYPSPGPPPSAPPPVGPWAQQAQHPPPPPPPHHHQQHHPPPPQPPQQHVQQPPPHIQSHQHQQTPAPIPATPAYIVPQHLQPPQPQPQPPPPQQPQQHVPQQQQPQHPHQFQQPQQLVPFGRTTAIVPTTVDTRPAYPTNTSEPERIPPGRTETMNDLSAQCNILYNFAHRYSQMQNMHAQAQPLQAELEDMSQRAQHVVRLLEDLRRMTHVPEPEPSRVAASESMQESPDDPRPPKRPWEDISQDEGPQSEQNSFTEQYPSAPASDPDIKPQSTAEQDMELIRTKRATTTANANGPPGQPKSKYRKRSRATPPGKCHSCNIRETPEWRRGPDGARTLCNACGLHYAKLMRKRDKNGNGDTPHIDLETLRASARAAENAEKASRAKQSRSQQSEPSSPADIKQQTPQQHHQGSFQLVNVVNVITPSAEHSTSTASSDASRAPAPPPPAQSGMHAAAAIPPPPWATPAPPAPARPYASNEHMQQHQSFMRSSQHGAPSR